MRKPIILWPNNGDRVRNFSTMEAGKAAAFKMLQSTQVSGPVYIYNKDTQDGLKIEWDGTISPYREPLPLSIPAARQKLSDALVVLEAAKSRLAHNVQFLRTDREVTNALRELQDLLRYFPH